VKSYFNFLKYASVIVGVLVWVFILGPAMLSSNTLSIIVWLTVTIMVVAPLTYFFAKNEYNNFIKRNEK